MLVQLAITVLLSKACVGIYYDSYTGKPANKSVIERYISLNILQNCTNDIVMPCNDSEPRRLDGSCNNAKFPASGTYHTPLYRMLPPVFSKNDEPRKSVSGKDLPAERETRVHMLANGKGSDLNFTQLLTFMAAVNFADIGTVHDTMNYLAETITCCKKEGKSEPMCSPIIVPENDPTHRYSGIRCMNLTKPKTFQTYGCAATGTEQSRIEFTTPFFDLSFLYRSNEPTADYRLYKKGMLLYEVAYNSVWPWSQGPNNVTSCMANVRENGENRCFGVVQGSIPPVTLAIIGWYRMHNIVASELSDINPHWSDERLFQTTREILIALYNQMHYYELYPKLIGKQYALDSGLISKDTGFRDVYDPTINPQASFDYMYALRWFHSCQEGAMKMYDENNHYVSQVPTVNLTLRVGFFSQGENYPNICRGTFLQSAGAVDDITDSELSEQGLGGMQRATDLTANDLKKGRLFGVPPYVDYIEASGRPKPKTWEELAQYIKPKTIVKMQELYEDVCDVDLMTGLWGEDKIEDGYATPTVSYIIVDNMKRLMVADRHWYERADRPNAFTYEQLQEIRKANFAAYMCVTEPKIKTITRDPFLKVSESNPLVSCDDITKWNLEAWREDSDSC